MARGTTIQVLREAHRDNPLAISDLETEMQIMISLRHPSILRVLGFGETGRGLHVELVPDDTPGRVTAPAAASLGLARPRLFPWPTLLAPERGWLSRILRLAD